MSCNVPKSTPPLKVVSSPGLPTESTNSTKARGSETLTPCSSTTTNCSGSVVNGKSQPSLNVQVFGSPTKINVSKHIGPAITNGFNHTALKQDKVSGSTEFSGDLNARKDIQDPIVSSYGCVKQNEFDSADVSASMSLNCWLFLWLRCPTLMPNHSQPLPTYRNYRLRMYVAPTPKLLDLQAQEMLLATFKSSHLQEQSPSPNLRWFMAGGFLQQAYSLMARAEGWKNNVGCLEFRL
jgi:hypothetical protein